MFPIPFANVFDELSFFVLFKKIYVKYEFRSTRIQFPGELSFFAVTQNLL